jgi:hypothetical protein
VSSKAQSERPESLRPAVARDGSTWSEVTPLGAGAYRVRLGGAFRPAFMATLGMALSERLISIDRVHATRARDWSWLAELHVIALVGAHDPMTVPFVALADADIAHEVSPLMLDRYELIESGDHGGTLRLTLEAQDSLGLLGSLLSSLATFLLFPVELHIETRSGRAHDRLWLGGIGTSAPSRKAEEALRRLLAGSLKNAVP